MQIEIKNLTDAQIEERGVHSWPIWSCEISEFDWEYSDQETCLLLEGEVEVSSEFATVRFSDVILLFFPKD